MPVSLLAFDVRCLAVIRFQLCNSASVSTERSSQPKTGVQESKDWEIKMLYDGGCPLCMREVNMLRRRDTGVNKIRFVDIDAPDYDPAQNAGISYEEVLSCSQAPA